MPQEKLYRVFRCFCDSDIQSDVGYYSSSEDPKNILVKSAIGQKVELLFNCKSDLLEFAKRYMKKHNDKTEFKTEKELVDAIEQRGKTYLCKLYCEDFDKEIVICHIDFAECEYAIENPDTSYKSFEILDNYVCYYVIIELNNCNDALKLIDGDINQYLKITDCILEKK